eukprot:CAMPEP_0206396062 /NCGR_PEP_ID=MMETSP0294-20121207/22537_1 /ASSEMBLY_ACC=CAM_ASM_000327 /TAXON_ID=39354 /ORGANISM="Heterosigma akashiwo, Strain CCMP2393" /LENGTH=100 /DNA_ID=CAMNT_0053850673 /DNA_START=717 /DNA_END=1019 /DNA_ORIENTATION=-
MLRDLDREYFPTGDLDLEPLRAGEGDLDPLLTGERDLEPPVLRPAGDLDRDLEGVRDRGGGEPEPRGESLRGDADLDGLFAPLSDMLLAKVGFEQTCFKI